MSFRDWATTARARRYGRARRGARVGGDVPHGPWKTATLLAALGTDGLSAPCVFDGAINGACFSAYVEKALAPTLRPGDIGTMDNLGAHKVRVCAKPSLPWALLYLQPYSPGPQGDRAVAKLKTVFQSAAARTVDDAFGPVNVLVPRPPWLFHLTGGNAPAIVERVDDQGICCSTGDNAIVL